MGAAKISESSSVARMDPEPARDGVHAASPAHGGGASHSKGKPSPSTDWVSAAGDECAISGPCLVSKYKTSTYMRGKLRIDTIRKEA
jgi:hypothetical protein